MSWDDKVCLGEGPECEGYKGAPCDCFKPYDWTPAQHAESDRLLAEIIAAVPSRPRLSLAQPVSDADLASMLRDLENLDAD